MKKPPKQLDAITYHVLNYRPKPKSAPTKKRRRKKKKIERESTIQFPKIFYLKDFIMTISKTFSKTIIVGDESIAMQPYPRHTVIFSLMSR
ncbi:MAG: hypothetical protein V3T17_11260 [Pseudomonadales bacterium]